MINFTWPPDYRHISTSFVERQNWTVRTRERLILFFLQAVHHVLGQVVQQFEEGGRWSSRSHFQQLIFKERKQDTR